jgi:hypothetical protein
MVPESFPEGKAKRSGSEFDHTLLSGAEAKNGWSYTSTHICLYGEKSDNLLLLVLLLFRFCICVSVCVLSLCSSVNNLSNIFQYVIGWSFSPLAPPPPPQYTCYYVSRFLFFKNIIPMYSTIWWFCLLLVCLRHRRRAA